MTDLNAGDAVSSRVGGTESTCRHLFLIIVGVALCVSGLATFVPVRFTNSGVIFVYAVEIAAAVGWLVILFHAGAARLHVDAQAIRFIKLVLALVVFCLIVTGLRFATGYSDLKSLLILRNVLAGSWLVAGVLLFRPSSRAWITLCAAGTIPLAFAALLLSNTQGPWAYEFWQNHSIRAMLVTASLGTVTYALLNAPQRSWRHKGFWILWSSLVFATTWLGLASGSRVNAMLVPLVIFVCVAVSGAYTRGGALVVGCTVVLLALASLHLLQGCGTLVQYGLERSPGIAQWLTNAEQCELRDEPAPSQGTSADDVDVSRSQSSSGRFQVWEQASSDLLENPLIGVGLRQYEAVYTTGENARTLVLTPHNFILEYGLAYGVVGLVWFLVLLLYFPIRQVLRGPNRWLALPPTAAVGYLLATAFFQPTLLNCGLSLWLWVPVAVLANGDRNRVVRWPFRLWTRPSVIRE